MSHNPGAILFIGLAVTLVSCGDDVDFAGEMKGNIPPSSIVHDPLFEPDEDDPDLENIVGTEAIEAWKGLRSESSDGMGMTRMAVVTKRTVYGYIKHNGLPAVGVRVEAWDSDPDADDLMGTSHTDSNGYYEIHYRDKPWDPCPGWASCRRPDIYIRIKLQRWHSCGSSAYLKWNEVDRTKTISNWKMKKPRWVDYSTGGSLKSDSEENRPTCGSNPGVDVRLDKWNGWGPAVIITLNKETTCDVIGNSGKVVIGGISAAVAKINAAAGLIVGAALAANKAWIKANMGIAGVVLYINIPTGALYRVETRGCSSTCDADGCSG